MDCGQRRLVVTVVLGNIDFGLKSKTPDAISYSDARMPESISMDARVDARIALIIIPSFLVSSVFLLHALYRCLVSALARFWVSSSTEQLAVAWKEARSMTSCETSSFGGNISWASGQD